MNTLATLHPPDTDRVHLTASAVPTIGATPTFVDRLSLRLGLWLLLRSARRLQRDADHDERARRLRNERERAARETAAAREQLLTAVRA